MSSLSNWSNTEPYAKSTLGGNVQEFMAHVLSSKTHEVSRSNIWHFDMTFPTILRGDLGNLFAGAFTTSDLSSARKTITMYANEVNTPTRQVTTSSHKMVGSEYEYATGSTFSETNVQFFIPRNYIGVTIFERWMNIMANDANQYVDFFDDYVAPTFTIYKLERGGGGDIPLTNEILKTLKSDNRPQFNKVAGMWVMFNVFPKNIGTLQFNNQPGAPLTLDVTLRYERFRFYPDPSTDVKNTILV